jgi:hypothetical protein
MLTLAEGWEAELVEIKSSLELRAWLKNQPQEVSIAFFARAAQRVLPLLERGRGGRYNKGDFFSAIVLPVFRMTSLMWFAAQYPNQAAHLHFNAAAFATANANAVDNLPSTDANATFDAVNAARFGFKAAFGDFDATSAFDAASSATAWAADPATYDAAAARAPFWSAVSFDATQVKKGKAGSKIAHLPLWPNGPPSWPYRQPEKFKTLWEAMKRTLNSAKEDWDVWITWYEDRLQGRVREEAHELAYVEIDEGLWNQGPAVVNAAIKKRIEELEQEPPPQGRS